MSLFEEAPYQSGIKFIHYRIWWILFATMIAPAILSRLGLPVAWVLFTSTLLALPACIADCKKLGIKLVTLCDVLIVVIIAAGIIVMSGLVSKFWRLQLEHFGFKFNAKQPVAEIIAAGSRFDLIILYISVCIITPIVEEVLFRRLIYGIIQKYSALAAFAGTALIFALVHFFVPGLPGLFILGCGFQFIFLFRKNLACAMLAHAIVNSLAFFANRS